MRSPVVGRQEDILRQSRWTCLRGVVGITLLLSTPLFAGATIRVPADTPSLQTAFSLVPDGGAIEIAAGTYPAPTGGWRITNLGKGFTIRAEAGAEVILSGGGTTDILRMQNSSVASGGPVVFQSIVFSDGRSTTEGIAAGVTLYRARATFVDCTFRDNVANVTTTVGGGVYVAENSEVVFVECLWTSNTSKVGGAGLGVRTACTVFVHDSEFNGNLANPPNHQPYSGGGGINVGNSTLRVTNTAFIANEATYGGALYAIGNWQEPYTSPRAHVVVANCWFQDNRAERDPSVGGALPPTEGGAVNAEDQTWMGIYNCRFVTNQAEIGGGVNIYRAEVEIQACTFRGNRVVDPDPYSGFGGAIKATSDDGPSDGTNNRPAAQLTVEDTLIQGRYGAVTTVAQTGGGLFAAGDGARMDGDPTVPDIGTLAENQAQVVVRRVVVDDCDVYAPQAPFSGVGGGVVAAIAHLTIEDSLITGSDALGVGEWGSGGGAALLARTTAVLTGTTFVGNTAGRMGGGLFAQGCELDVDGCQLAENEVSPGVTEPESESYGAAISTTIEEASGIDATGVVANSRVVRNVGMGVFDDDRNTSPTVPINDTRYNGNQLHSGQYGGRVYRDSLTASQTAAGLNALVVVRGNGLPSTDKSQVDNSSPASPPSLGALIAAPPSVLMTAAPSEPSPPTPAFVGYGWSGSDATLDGSSLSANGGVAQASTGSHDLAVDGQHFFASTAVAATPEADLDVTPPAIPTGGVCTLSWQVTSGTFLTGFIDQGIGVIAGESGSIEVSPAASRPFRLLVVTSEGGVAELATVTVGATVIFQDGFESGNGAAWSDIVP